MQLSSSMSAPIRPAEMSFITTLNSYHLYYSVDDLWSQIPTETIEEIEHFALGNHAITHTVQITCTLNGQVTESQSRDFAKPSQFNIMRESNFYVHKQVQLYHYRNINNPWCPEVCSNVTWIMYCTNLTLVTAEWWLSIQDLEPCWFKLQLSNRGLLYFQTLPVYIYLYVHQLLHSPIARNTQSFATLT